MSAITTHVLDLTRGRPAAGIKVLLEFLDGHDWRPAGSGITDADGRCRELLASPPSNGTYRLRFDTGRYFVTQGVVPFYPEVVVSFVVETTAAPHFHVPLLLSPFGYSTYRGS
ncbi:MAG: hydroxyisourate hydrolase [Acidobacteriota bacterium]